MSQPEGALPQQGSEDHDEKSGAALEAQLMDAEARVDAGLDPVPPYYEGTPAGNIAKIIESRNQPGADEKEKYNA